jgi:hypothetical protein
MKTIILRPSEIRRLKAELLKVPLATSIELTQEVTSEFGRSVFLCYFQNEEKKIDLTEMDNF